MCEGKGEASVDLITYARLPPAESGTVTGEEADNQGVEARRKPRGWKAVAFILGNDAAVQMAVTGFSTNLTVYLVGRFNMEEVAATNVTNIFTGTLSFAPLAGAFIADAYWGRFRTLVFGIITNLLGMIVITLSASVPQLKPPVCSPLAQQSGTCFGPSKLQRAVLYIGMALLVIGSGGAGATNLPFGADQFDETNERHKKGLKSYFNWYYATNMMAVFLSLIFIVYIQDKVSWALGFAIPTGLMIVTLVVFFVGTMLYVHVPPEGSIFSSLVRVFVASFQKRRLRLPHPEDVRQQESLLFNPSTRNHRVLKLPLTSEFTFLNKAAIISDTDQIKPDGSPAKPWNLCSIQQVEEVKCLIRIIPIWLAGTMCYISVTELTNYTILQSLRMDRSMGKNFEVAPASIIAIFYLSLALFVPIYDVIIIPIAKKYTKVEGGFTLLQRQGIGIVIGSLAFVAAANVEYNRRNSALDHGGVSPMSVFWLTPQLALIGIAAAFNLIGQMEFYNTQFPEQMRTLGNSAFYCAQGAANYLASLVVSIVNSRTSRHGKSGWISNDINAGRLDYFYYTVAIFGVVNFIYFLICAYFYSYKGIQSSDKTTDTSGDEAVLR